MADINDFRPGDVDNNILRKILARLKAGITVTDVTLDASDIEIGAVELKDATTDTRVKITGAAPSSGDNAVVVRNIPSGTQAVTVVDGGSVTQGAVADAAVTNPALSGSVIALLKGIISKLAGNLAVTTADGANVAQGAVADAAVTNPALSGSVIALLKGVISKLAGNLAVTTADGANVAQGAVADAAVTNPASSGSVVALLKGIISKLAGSLSVTITAGLKVVSQTFTRPNDSNAYSISDVVNNSTSAPVVITFAAVASAVGGAGYITKARLVTDSTTTTNALFRLYLYSVAPTAINDNAPFTLLYANRANRLGHIDFALSTEGAGSDSATSLVLGVNLPFTCAVADTALYGVLVAKAAYAPAAQQNFYVELSADLN